MTLADGQVEEPELATIALVAARENISEESVQELLKRPKETKLVVPRTDAKKKLYLKDLILLMISDGHIDEKEFALCKLIAIKYGYHHEIIDSMLLGLITEIQEAIKE